jgi:hypothetical protein
LSKARGVTWSVTQLTFFVLTGIVTIAQELTRDPRIVEAQKEILDKQQELSTASLDIVALNILAISSQQILNIHKSGNLDLSKADGVQDMLRELGTGFGSEVMIKMITEEGNAKMNSLRSYSATFTSLLQENEAAQVALEEALSVWQTVEGKYNSVIDDLNSADKSDRAFAELIHINAAETAWDQLTNYCEQVVINNLKKTG